MLQRVDQLFRCLVLTIKSRPDGYRIVGAGSGGIMAIIPLLSRIEVRSAFRAKGLNLFKPGWCRFTGVDSRRGQGHQCQGQNEFGCQAFYTRVSQSLVRGFVKLIWEINRTKYCHGEKENTDGNDYTPAAAGGWSL